MPLFNQLKVGGCNDKITKGVKKVAGLNRIILTGILTKDPEIRHTKEEIPVARFTVAVNRIKKAKETETDYFTCVAWRGLANICGDYLKKGSLVAIEGKLAILKYESKGIMKSAPEIRVDNIIMLDNKFFKAATNEKENDDE